MLARRPLHIELQPDDRTCGATSLHAVYRYHGDEFSLAQLIEEIPQLPGGGTLAVHLGCHALRRDYRATIYTYNLQLFDPTWFREGVDLAERLRAQAKVKRSKKLQLTTTAYLDYLALGGKVLYDEGTARVLSRHLRAGRPVLTGLSATYLYQSMRELDDKDDDLAGDPVGHFVVLWDYEPQHRLVHVADPLQYNERYATRHYAVRVDRVVAAIFLGVLTYDANLLVLEPVGRASRRVKRS